MDILNKALEAHRAGRTTVRDNALLRAEQIGLLDPEVAFKTTATKFICGLASIADLNIGTEPSQQDLDFIGWVALQRMEYSPADTAQLAKQMTAHGARFKVLALRAQALTGSIDTELVATTPPRALQRAIDISTGAAKSRLQAAAAVEGYATELAADAILDLANSGDIATALDTAAAVFSQTANPDVAEAAAMAAGLAGKHDAKQHWLQHCTPLSAAFISAAVSPSSTTWTSAADMRAEAGLIDMKFAKACASACAFGQTEHKLLEWAQLSFTNAAAAAHFAQLLVQHELGEAAASVALQHPDSPTCTLILAQNTDSETTEINLARSVATSRQATPAEILTAAKMLLKRSQRPTGSLQALVNHSDATLEQRTEAATMLAAMAVNSIASGPATANTLYICATELATDETTKVMWLFAAARSGSTKALADLENVQGHPRHVGWAKLAIAQAAQRNHDMATFVTALTDAHTAASLAGDKELSAEIETLVNLASNK